MIRQHDEVRRTERSCLQRQLDGGIGVIRDTEIFLKHRKMEPRILLRKLLKDFLRLLPVLLHPDETIIRRRIRDVNLEIPIGLLLDGL